MHVMAPQPRQHCAAALLALLERHGQAAEQRIGDLVLQPRLYANLAAADRGETGEVYNISGGSRVSVMEIIRLLERLTGRRARIENRHRQKGDPTDTGGDPARALKDSYSVMARRHLKAVR